MIRFAFFVVAGLVTFLLSPVAGLILGILYMFLYRGYEIVVLPLALDAFYGGQSGVPYHLLVFAGVVLVIEYCEPWLELSRFQNVKL